MNASGQERFLERVRRSLGLARGKRQVGPDFFSGSLPGAELEKIKGRTREERLVLAKRFAEGGKAVNLQVALKPDEAAVAESLVRLVLEKEPEWGTEKSVAAWRHPLIDRLGLEEALAGHGVPVLSFDPARGTARTMREKVAGALLGVTSADYGVAETNTLVLKTRPGQPRCISLLPLIHAVVLPLERIVLDFRELVTVLKHDPDERAEGLGRCTSFISGPSKTGDIELVMVHGAHGPREMYLYVITG